MKRVTWGYLVIGVAIFSGCAAKKNMMSKGDTTLLVGKKWQLTELNGNSVAEKINGNVPYLELLAEGGRYSASGGCNGIGGEYELLKNNEIKFERGMSTMMACPDMTIEQGLGKVFSEASRYNVSDSTLTLASADSVLAKFKLSEQSSELAGSWELDYILEPNASIETLFPVKRPQMTFDIVNGKVSGSGGCNNFNSSVTISGSGLKFGPVMSTKMACQGTAEDVFFKGLDDVTSFSTNSRELTLIAGDIAVMRLKKI